MKHHVHVPNCRPVACLSTSFSASVARPLSVCLSATLLHLQELHESHLTLVEGSAFNERDLLHRAGLPASLGALVLADRYMRLCLCCVCGGVRLRQHAAVMSMCTLCST